MSDHDSCPPGVFKGREFRTTRWDQIRAATEGSGSVADEARDSFCQTYWFPLYSYVRRIGHGHAEAEDLIQGFFENLWENNQLESADPGRGRLRSFLLGTLKHHLSDERKRASAQKRGSGRLPVSLNADDMESRYLVEAADGRDPEALFDRRWGFELLGRALAQLRAEFEARGRGGLFTELQAFLGGAGVAKAHAEIGARLGMTENAVKVAVHRLREEFGLRLRAEVAKTLQDKSEVDAELRHLLRVTVE